MTPSTITPPRDFHSFRRQTGSLTHPTGFKPNTNRNALRFYDRQDFAILSGSFEGEDTSTQEEIDEIVSNILPSSMGVAREHRGAARGGTASGDRAGRKGKGEDDGSSVVSEGTHVDPMLVEDPRYGLLITRRKKE